VLKKEVEEGQTVASSFNTPTLFTIAKDLTDMRVIADVDEADIGEVKEGQRVSFTVDAFPNDTFEGAVTQVRQQPTTESNVVTYQVVISAPNQDLKLKPGLTANVNIFTLEMPGVLAIPNKALRFKPSEAMLNDGETITDVESPIKVWTKEGPNLKAIAVQTGVTNGTLTQITSGLTAGTKVIVDVQTSMPDFEEGAQQNSNPFMPKPKNRNQDKDKKKQ
jgi:HlyD family secretion protein